MQATGPAIRITHDFRTHRGHGETGICNVLGRHTWELRSGRPGRSDAWVCVHCPTVCGLPR